AFDNGRLTDIRKDFLVKKFIDNEDPKREGKGPHRVRGIEFGSSALSKAGLDTLINIKALPLGSATLSLRFKLLSPLLTKDDDPFYLFDNPVRRDHVFGVPYLSAASIKGLSADAYQRAFTGSAPLSGDDDAARTRQFRLNDPHARRLFGIADDGVQDGLTSQAGRLHFSPVWFNAVQYLVMNPMDDEKGVGTLPIHFEAIAPVTADGKPVEAQLNLFYFNPAGAEESDMKAVRGDLARWLASVASWWPVLGLGAKRLAGYGAIEPVAAQCAAKGWEGWDSEKSLKGENSWMTLAELIAKGA
ncbi:MAG: RAMP superfamily CRISPR-associated protein, partial [Methylococcaceae bacterium]